MIDSELVAAAQHGDATSLGALLQRYWPALVSQAIALLGNVADAEDVAQDTVIVALGGIDRLREPDAAGAWLRAITRNLCYARLRRRWRDLPLDDALIAQIDAAVLRSAEQSLDRLALRDWIWTALAELPEPLRVTAMLRYFSAMSSYDAIARILDVPPGTVASRLNLVKGRLADALLRTADLPHDDARELADRLQRYAVDMFANYNDDGDLGQAFGDLLDEEVIATQPGCPPLAGRDRVVDDLARRRDEDRGAGVGLLLRTIRASRDVMVLEADFLVPPGVTHACPPTLVEVHLMRNGLTRRLYRCFAHPALTHRN